VRLVSAEDLSYLVLRRFFCSFLLLKKIGPLQSTPLATTPRHLLTGRFFRHRPPTRVYIIFSSTCPMTSARGRFRFHLPSFTPTLFQDESYLGAPVPSQYTYRFPGPPDEVASRRSSLFLPVPNEAQRYVFFFSDDVSVTSVFSFAEGFFPPFCAVLLVRIVPSPPRSPLRFSQGPPPRLSFLFAEPSRGSHRYHLLSPAPSVMGTCSGQSVLLLPTTHLFLQTFFPLFLACFLGPPPVGLLSDVVIRRGVLASCPFSAICDISDLLFVPHSNYNVFDFPLLGFTFFGWCSRWRAYRGKRPLYVRSPDF